MNYIKQKWLYCIFAVTFVVSPAVLNAHTSLVTHRNHGGHSECKPLITGVRYMYEYYQRIGDGSGKITKDDVFARGFEAAPTRQIIHSVMVDLSYMIDNRWTFYLEFPYFYKRMDYAESAAAGGRQFHTRSQGLGDVIVAGTYNLYHCSEAEIRVKGGVSLPTGSICKRYNTVLGQDQLLSYPMQLGSGTFDPIVGAILEYDYCHLLFRLDGEARFRLDKNERHYRLKHRYDAAFWMGYTHCDWIDGFFKLKGIWWNRIKGQDPELNIARAPTMDPRKQKGWRLDGSLGVNFYPGTRYLKDHILTVEAGVPFYQYLEGPQLRYLGFITARWSINW